MKTQTVRLLLAGLLAGSLVAGCGGGNSASSTGDNAGSGGNAGSSVIKIATQSPLSGSQSLEGDGIKLGAQLAVQDRAEDFKKLGFDLQLFPQDDQADPKIGVSNAEMLIADPDVYAVIGHYNTGVAIPSSVKYEEGKLAMISPANTGVELTEAGAFSPFAYDATLVALNGIEQAIKDNGGKKPTREQVMNAIRSTNEFNGLFTKVTFDEKGDNKHSQVYIYRYGKDKAEFIGEAGQ